MMKTDTAAFVTFRVAGDKLDPAQVTALLGLPPTHAYAKGAHYQRGGRAQVARTGVWYFSTDGVVDSSSLEDHAIYLLKFSALGSNIQKLRNLIEENSLHAVVTMFWSGPSGARHPVVPEKIVEIFQHIPAKVEVDFDSDYRVA